MSKYPGYLKIHKDKKMRYLTLSGFDCNVLHETMSNTRRGYSAGELREVDKLLDQLESYGTSHEGNHGWSDDLEAIIELNDKQYKLAQAVIGDMTWNGKHRKNVIKFLEKFDNAATVDPRVKDEPPATPMEVSQG